MSLKTSGQGTILWLLALLNHKFVATHKQGAQLPFLHLVFQPISKILSLLFFEWESCYRCTIWDSCLFWEQDPNASQNSSSKWTKQQSIHCHGMLPHSKFFHNVSLSIWFGDGSCHDSLQLERWLVLWGRACWMHVWKSEGTNPTADKKSRWDFTQQKKQQSIIFTYSLEGANNVGTSFQYFTKKEGFFPIATIAGQRNPAKHRKATKTNTE